MLDVFLSQIARWRRFVRPLHKSQIGGRASHGADRLETTQPPT